MTTQEFTAKLTADNHDLTEKLQNCKAPEEAYAIAKSEGLTDTYDEFTDTMKALYESVKDLADEDMDVVAGGVDGSDIAATASIAATIGSVAAVAAIIPCAV